MTSDNDRARRARVRAIVAYPAVSVALVFSIALALTPSGPAQGAALVPSPSPTETTTPVTASAPATPTPTSDGPTPSGSPSPTSDLVVPTETLAPTGRTTALYPLLSPTPVVSDTTSPTAVPVVSAPPNTGGTTLAAPSLGAPIITSPNIHGPYDTTSSECATCHRTHTAQGPNLLTKSIPQSTLCFTCHDGTGANTNVQATYTDPLVPQNVVSDRKIFRHDTLAPTAHTSSKLNEFGGVSNRHSECGDCHNPHQARGTDSTPTTTGVTNSGRLAGISGVSVVNGPAGTAPSYTFLPGAAAPITREYQLCFKCHSGFTILDSNAGFTPSRYRLDKGIEFNPANPSYHPVEAPGKNTTPAMTASLAGPSSFKQYNLTTASTISCANCHSNYQRYNLVTPPSITASSPLHASKNAGILRQTYRNRVLLSAQEPYDEGDFALCFMCHSSTPFTDGTSTATNFNQHAKHISLMVGRDVDGGTPDIDTIGGGRGNAICAECHFRQHSTTFQIPQQSGPNKSRLVSFAPSVQPYNGTLSWVPGATVGTGSCTLTCHGRSHRPKSYPGRAGW